MASSPNKKPFATSLTTIIFFCIAIIASCKKENQANNVLIYSDQNNSFFSNTRYANTIDPGMILIFIDTETINHSGGFEINRSPNYSYENEVENQNCSQQISDTSMAVYERTLSIGQHTMSIYWIDISLHVYDYADTMTFIIDP